LGGPRPGTETGSDRPRRMTQDASTAPGRYYGMAVLAEARRPRQLPSATDAARQPPAPQGGRGGDTQRRDAPSQRERQAGERRRHRTAEERRDGTAGRATPPATGDQSRLHRLCSIFAPILHPAPLGHQWRYALPRPPRPAPAPRSPRHDDDAPTARPPRHAHRWRQGGRWPPVAPRLCSVAQNRNPSF
jgi:hypothetical protein